MSEYWPSMDGVRTGYPERGELIQAVTDAPYTPSMDTIREFFVDGAAGEFIPEDFDRAIAAHVASEVERLADEIEHSPTNYPGTAWFNKDMSEWVRERAAEIREGKNS